MLDMAKIPLYPYGYKLNYLGKKEVHEERASIVRLIYEKIHRWYEPLCNSWHLNNYTHLASTRGFLRPVIQHGIEDFGG